MPAMETSHFVWNSCPNSEHMQSGLLEYALRCNTPMTMAQEILSNSVYDLEPAAFKMNPNILPIAPLLATNKTGNLPGTFWAEDFSCLKWLDQQPTQSVIYIAFGSKTTFDQTPFQEFATALELCNRPFLWVVRPDFVENLSEASDPEGFHERVGASSWAHNKLGTSTESPGTSFHCLLFTYCGWNSTTEALVNGDPLWCWPFITEQIHNQVYIYRVWKVGVGFNTDKGGLVIREEIINKVEDLLANDKCKANALELKEKLNNHIKPDGSSYDNFIVLLISSRSNCSSPAAFIYLSTFVLLWLSCFLNLLQ